ncbi:MAG: helix-turn-helix transcriptional regulator [Bacteroidota bacterium]|nr:helix-turn-helix transcriptional regulator [Bacteroidota bacterium]
MINENVLNEARTMIASFLANRRKELGFTQIELASITGMGEATIKRVESGKFWINLKQYLILCQALNCYPFIAGKEKDEEWVKLMRDRWGKRGDN